MGKKGKPQSRITYENNNPNWTVRLTKALFIALQVFLENSGLSRRDFIAIALGKQIMNLILVRNEGYNQGLAVGNKQGYDKGSGDGYNNGWQQGLIAGEDKGYNKGYQDGREVGRKEGKDEGREEMYQNMKDKGKLWYFCAICGEPIVIDIDSAEHLFIIQMMRYHYWAHAECRNNQNYFY
jgi:hypothetical protein